MTSEPARRPSQPASPQRNDLTKGPPPSDPATRSPVAPRGLRALPIAAVFAVIVGVIVAIVGSSSQAPAGSGIAVASPTEAATAGGYLVSVEELRQRVAYAALGIDPYQGALNDLLGWASDAVARPPQPIQPLIVVGNENSLVDDATRTYGIGLAYVATGDERYATAARATIMAWVDRVLFTQDTCPDNGGCHTSLVIGRVGAGFVFGADLIAGSASWTADDAASFRRWLRTVILPAPSERPNNWGDAGTFLRVAVADYLGDGSAFDAAIQKFRANLDLIEADGNIPEESRRGTAGISYTQEALQYKLAVARIAERRGIDLWDATGAKGGSLRAAVDRLAHYWVHPDEWPAAQNVVVPTPGPTWELAFAHWQDPRWIPMVEAVRPYGDRGHSAIRWVTLTNGIPLRPIAAAGSPSTSPSPAVKPSPTPEGSEPVPPGSPGVTTPMLTGLTATLVESPSRGDIAVRIGWTTADPRGSVRVDWSSTTSWHRLGQAAASDGLVDTRPDGTRAYRGRRIVAGAPGPWLELTGVVADRFQATSQTLKLGGTWTLAGSSTYGGGSALSTTQVGATATWQGVASDLLVIGPVGPTRGRIAIVVDGRTVDTVNLRAASFVARRVLAALHWDSTGQHTVTIRSVASSGGRTVAVDELVRLDGGSLSAPGS